MQWLSGPGYRIVWWLSSLYLIKCRIEKAKKLLGSTDMSIMKVSMMSGYSNPAYFTKHFKRITGITPKEYRAQLEDLKG